MAITKSMDASGWIAVTRLISGTVVSIAVSQFILLQSWAQDLRDADEVGRIEAGQLDDIEPLENLIDAIKNGGTVETTEALRRLSHRPHRGRDVIQILLDTLGHKDQAIRSIASDVLYEIGIPSVRHLREQLGESTGRKRAAIASTLGRLDELQMDDLESFASDPDPRVRAVAAQYAAHQNELGTTLLIRMTEDPELAVVVAATKGLAACQANRDQAVEALISVLSSPICRDEALSTLSDYGMDAQRAIPAIVSAWSYYDVELALEHIGPPHLDDVPSLVSLLFHENPEVQILAAQELAMLGDQASTIADDIKQAAEETIERYLERQRELESKTDEERRYDRSGRMLVVIQRFADCVWSVTGDGDRFLDLYVIVAEKTDFNLTYLHEQTWMQLGEHTHPKIRQMLMHSHRAVRVSALQGIERMGPSASPLRNEVAGFLNDADEWTRINASKALAAIGPDANALAMPNLVDSLQNGEITLKDFARSISQLESTSMEVQVILENGLNSSERWTNGVCAQALAVASPDPDKSAELIIEAARQGRFSTNRTAISALSRMELKEGVFLDFLIEQLDSSEAWTRHDAAIALGKLGPTAHNAVEPLQRLLNDGHSETRFKAGQALYLIADDPQPLREMLEESLAQTGYDSRASRFHALEAIVELGGAGVAFQDIILNEYRKPQPEYLDLIVAACGAIGSHEAREVLEELKQSRDWVIHSAATSALTRIDDTSQEVEQ